jgi:hypothetical protein
LPWTRGCTRPRDRSQKEARCPGKPKTAITLRLDEDVVQAYRETGEGWQTRINADSGTRASSASALRRHHATRSARLVRLAEPADTKKQGSSRAGTVAGNSDAQL